MQRGCCSSRRQAASPKQASENGSLSEAISSAVFTPDFWQSFEERRPVHAAGAAAGLPGLFGASDLVAALTKGSSLGDAAAYKRGEPYQRENFFLAYLDNATLRLAEAESYFPSLLEICQGLAQSFDYVTARLVLEPPNTSGPALVADGELLVLQLWGERRLRLLQQVMNLPVTAPRPEPLLSPVLRPGDVLYVPNSLEMKAAPSSAPSLFLLLTLRNQEHSFDASFSKYLTDLLVQESFSEDADSFFRSAVTKHTVPERYSGKEAGEDAADRKAALSERMSRSVSELVSKISGDKLRAHHAERMRVLRQKQLQAAGKVRVQPPLPRNSVMTQSTVRVAHGISCRCAVGDKVAYFKRGTETLNLPIAETASALINALCDGEPHVVGSLPCEDPFERICVCQILVFKSCLEVVGETRLPE